MTNLFRNHKEWNLRFANTWLTRKQQSNFLRSKGAATLLVAMVLLILSTLIIIFAANFGVSLNKITANQTRNAQAFQAAEAGMEYAINYLQQNYSTVVAGPSGGYINYTNAGLTDVTLANNSKYSVVYTNPTPNNYRLIEITSTGVSDDSTATRIIKQQVQYGSLLVDPGTTSLVSKGSITMGGNANVTNTGTNQTIASALGVSFSGNAQTTISSGIGSNSAGTGADVQQNQNSLSSMSQNDFFAKFFGTTSTNTVRGQVAHYYNNSSDTNYSSTLNGMTGTTIWIDQTSGSTASLSGTTTIGSPTNPVLLVVNGSFSMSGNTTVYGFIFVVGTSGITSITGNNTITGGLVTSDNLTMSGNSFLTFDATVLSNLQNLPSMSYFAKIPGSWKDF